MAGHAQIGEHRPSAGRVRHQRDATLILLLLLGVIDTGWKRRSLALSEMFYG